jgi:serine/threonine protein kinase/tetratricopeptide (TPR) repeat protein
VDHPAARLDAGQCVGGKRFEILRHLGSGGMGVVYLAFDHERHSQVALKTLRQFEPAALYRLKHEFRSLSDVVHPNLATLYELVSEGDFWFLTMEYVQGTNFIDYVRPRWGAAAAPTLPFPPTTVMEGIADAPTIEGIADAPTEDLIVGEGGEGGPPSVSSAPARWARPRLDRLRAALSQLAEGVMALHAAGKLHRDLKPPNVLVTAQDRVVILDFGLATELEMAGQGSSADRVVGTAAYMSPEQGAGLPLTEASDWYSVGVMLFEALTGRQPFVGRFAEMLLAKRTMDAPGPATLASGVPEDLDSLTVKLLSRQPRDRPSGPEVLRRIGWAPVSSSASRVAPSRPAAGSLVGRERHLAALRGALRTARGGRSVARLVHGRSGMGKSALVEAFLEDPEAADAVVLAGRCYERESVPYKALDMVVDELSKHLMRLPPAETDAVLPRDCAFMARLFPVLNRVPAVADAPKRQAEVLDPQEVRWRGFAALRELLTRLGDRCMLIVYVDDLQWGDLDSAALLTELLRPPNPPGLLLIVCCRDEDIESVPVLGLLLEPFRSGRLFDDVREIEVGPLSPPEATKMALGLMSTAEAGGRSAAERIAEESGGDPFFVAELVWHFQVGGAEPQEPRAPAGAISLDQALRARMARLPEDSRRLLTAVAVAGRPVSLSVAARAAELETESESALAVLRAGHLVKTHLGRVPREVEAFHDRIRETAVRSLDETTLQEWHRRLAFALEAAPRVDHEALAVHFRGAGDWERAAEHSSIAAAAAAKALAFERAARLYGWAIELRPPSHPERRDHWAHLGRALACAGRGLEAARAYEEAAKGATAAESLECRRRAAEQLLRSGHVDEGLGVLESVLSAVGMRLSKSPKGAFISLLFRRAVLAVRGLGFAPRDASEIPAAVLTQIDVCWAVAIGLARIDNIRAADFQTRHLLRALRAGETYRIARALATEAGFSSTLGKPKRTERLLKAASDLAESLGQPHARGLATFAGGVAAFYQGRFRAARDGCEKAEAIFREQCTGVAWEINTAVTYSLASLFYLGEARELAQRVPLHLSEARDRGDLYAAVEFATGRSVVAWLVGDQVARARDEIAQAIRPWSRRGFHSQHFWGLVARVHLELYAGDGLTAWRLLEERWPEIARSMILRVKFDLVEILGLRARSALALAAASPPMMAGLLDAAARDADRIGRQRVGLTRPVSRLLEAGVASLDGRTDRALQALGEAVDGFEKLEMALHAAAARWRRGQLLGGNDGRSLRAAAESYMRSEAIKKPDRMVAMLAPGFPG